MRSSKRFLVALLFTLFIAAALAGGSWEVGYAEGSVPPVPPTSPKYNPVTGDTEEPIKPGTGTTSPTVTGDEAVGASLLDVNKKTRLQVTADNGSLDKGNSIVLVVIDASTDARTTNLANLLEVVQVGVFEKPDYQLKGNLTHTWTLSDAELDAFKKDPTLSVLRYDETNSTWVKVDSVVQGNQITYTSNKSGLFTIGKVK